VKVTSIDDVILALVSALQGAVAYPVFDGPPSKLPLRTDDRFLAVGAEQIDEQTDPVDSAGMDQEWRGLGNRARYETLRVNCVAIGRAKTIADARAVAMAVLGDVGSNLSIHPTLETYSALVSTVTAVRSHNTTGGAVVQIQFIITANARLT
jgi:hypothetical protein